ncbi:MAG TPA: preprotein translocase subunit YajC [Dehalococcoidia bacterium]|jgi:preprotein translocase YajC subunit|nr:preprotein translocase subunit YajC [Dehalococcoidia bacterium]
MGSIWVIALAYPAIIALLFYFAFLRPVQQHQKKQRNELQSLRVGDEVLTQAGFIARIKEVRVPESRGPTELVLDLGGFEVRAVASAIVQRIVPPEAAADAEDVPLEAAEQQPSIHARGHS